MADDIRYDYPDLVDAAEMLERLHTHLNQICDDIEAAGKRANEGNSGASVDEYNAKCLTLNQKQTDLNTEFGKRIHDFRQAFDAMMQTDTNASRRF